MASNKNQHFVPRAHLKPFTIGEGDAAIHLFNLDRKRTILNAPVRGQCSRDYFYGQDEKLEHAIQFLEGTYATILRSVRDEPANLLPGHIIVLQRFAYLQHLRTEAAAKTAAEVAFAMGSMKGSDIELPPFREAVGEAVIAAMLAYADTMAMFDDLSVRIVQNRTDRPFITSDNPAVLANRWHQREVRTRGRSFGAGSAGLVVFLPLTPALLAVIFDNAVYSIEHKGGWLDTSSEADVTACNFHQVLNCAANLYFGVENHSDYVAAVAAEVADLRPATRSSLTAAVPDGGSETHSRFAVVENPDIREHEKVLLHTRTVHPVPPRWPSFVKFRAGGYVFGNGTGAGYRRRATAVSASADSPPWLKSRA